MASDVVAQPNASPSNRAGGSPGWTHQRFFALLEGLGRLRVISQCGPSTFEALCRFGPWSLERGFMNAITPDYHWHLALVRLRHVRSCDEVHNRSGRRVIFLELRERADAEPFLKIYVHREKGAEFEPEREARFAAAHAELQAGVVLEAKEQA